MADNFESVVITQFRYEISYYFIWCEFVVIFHFNFFVFVWCREFRLDLIRQILVSGWILIFLSDFEQQVKTTIDTPIILTIYFVTASNQFESMDFYYKGVLVENPSFMVQWWSLSRLVSFSFYFTKYMHINSIVI